MINGVPVYVFAIVAGIGVIVGQIICWMLL